MSPRGYDFYLRVLNSISHLISHDYFPRWVGISRVEVYKREENTDVKVLKGSFKISRTHAPNLFMQV